MQNFPEKLSNKLKARKSQNALRSLGAAFHLVDFSSNDYLGLAKSKVIFENTNKLLAKHNLPLNGATGSRLLSGNHKLYEDLEHQLCGIHNSEAALVYNSGYDANIGVLSCVPQRNDVILYDELVHASIRDGIGMSNAKSFKFKHNDLQHLSGMLKQFEHNDYEVYVITESVFSMDGDSPNLKSLCTLCKTYNVHLLIDEAHAIGVFGVNGQGLVNDLGLEDMVFARLITFGKALGCHGAAILGSQTLKQYLVNFSRPFIYTTGLSPHSVATISSAYEEMRQYFKISQNENSLLQNILFFKSELRRLHIDHLFIDSDSAIHCCITKGNENAKHTAMILQNHGFDVKPILSPTVPAGKERLRFCLHSYNTKEEITEVLELLSRMRS